MTSHSVAFSFICSQTSLSPPSRHVWKSTSPSPATQGSADGGGELRTSLGPRCTTLLSTPCTSWQGYLPLDYREHPWAAADNPADHQAVRKVSSIILSWTNPDSSMHELGTGRDRSLKPWPRPQRFGGDDGSATWVSLPWWLASVLGVGKLAQLGVTKAALEDDLTHFSLSRGTPC